jgi:ketosteroid isomerase-like protein
MDAGREPIRLVYDAINRRDLDAVLEAFDPAVELRMPMDPMRVHPVFRGREGVRAFHDVLFGAFETYRVDPQRIEELGRGVVVALGRLTVRPSGDTRERTIRFSHFWELADGRVTRLSLHESENPLGLVHSGRSLRAAA